MLKGALVQTGSHVSPRLAAAVRDRHLVPGRHERLGDRPADAAVATGDQYGPAHLGGPAGA